MKAPNELACLVSDYVQAVAVAAHEASFLVPHSTRDSTTIPFSVEG